jgi:hypothetical protein
MATTLRCVKLPLAATSVADTIATPSAEPHCLVAVSGRLRHGVRRAPTGDGTTGRPALTEEQRARWVALALRAADETMLPADPQLVTASRAGLAG